VKDLGGQVLESYYRRDFTHKDDGQYGYQKGGTLAEVWATPFIRKMVGENPNLLHTSINAWPTSGKPGVVPWRPSIKGMVIEGIRRQPQGSVDYVVRGGAGGRLLLAEGLEEEGAWPEVGEWGEQDRAFVVSLAESFYASGAMAGENDTSTAAVTLPAQPDEFRDWVAEHAPHLLPALAEADGANDNDADDKSKRKTKNVNKGNSSTMLGEGENTGLTIKDVQRLIQESQSGQPTVEEFEERLREQTDEILRERDGQRRLSDRAIALIESAEGIPATWKADLKARYVMLPSGPPAQLVISESDCQDDKGEPLTEEQVLEARVVTDLDHVRDLIAEARGKPRPRGEGGGRPENGSRQRSAADNHWRRRFVEMGLAESEDKAVESFGGKVTGD
jgi:DNA-binding transcriptional MerR regulator